MAIQSILRQSISNAVPLATRVIGASRTIHSATATTSTLKRTTAATLSPHLFRTAAYSLGGTFSGTVTAYDVASSDKKLLEVVESEINCVDIIYEKTLVVPDDFPFKLEDNPGKHTVTLRREYDDETMTIEVSMPDFGQEDEDEGEDDDEDAQTLCVPLLVNVTKKNGNGSSLEFECTVFPDEIRINGLSLKNPGTEDQIAYEGPDFLDLDENLQKAFHKYLEIRGLNPTTISFMHQYMTEKENKEYLRWLKDVKKFVQA